MASLIPGDALRTQLAQEQGEFFGDLVPRAEVLVPLGHCGLAAFDASTESFASGQREYGETIKVGVDISRHPQGKLLEMLRFLETDPSVSGVIVGEPLPDPSELHRIRQAIPIDKDIDGSNPNSTFHHRRPTPSAMMYVPKALGINLTTSNVVVVGAAGAIGSPLVSMLEAEGVRPYGIDFENRAETFDKVREADVVFCVANRPGLITADMLSGVDNLIVDGAIITNPHGPGKVGNVDPRVYDNDKVHSSITPVPGGIGLLNRLMVFANLQHTIERQQIAA